MQEIERQISPVKQRILQYIEYLGISKYSFYKITGLARSVLDKSSGLSEDGIAKFIAAYPGVSLEWLILGKGPIEKTISEQIVSNILDTNNAHKNAHKFVENQKVHKTLSLSNETLPDNYTSIPNIHAKNSLKLFVPYLPSRTFSFITKEADLSQFETYRIPGLRDADFLMPYYGDDMHPFVSSGNIIAGKIVPREPLYTWGRIHLFELETVGVVMGRLRPGSVDNRVRCEPDNPSFQSIEFPIENIIAIAMLMAVIKIL